MRAISLWEPWGTAIAKGLKKIETRHWAPPYRGPLAIHCAKTRDHAGFIHDPEVSAYFAGVDIFRESQLSFGCIVAVCKLVEIRSSEDLLPLVTPQERAFGNYEPFRFGWMIEDVIEIPKPIPFRGAQGFFNVPDALLNL